MTYPNSVRGGRLFQRLSDPSFESSILLSKFEYLFRLQKSAANQQYFRSSPQIETELPQSSNSELRLVRSQNKTKLPL